MLEHFKVILAFPWYVHLLILSPLIILVFGWWTRRNRNTPEQLFIDKWTKLIDKELKHVFWSCSFNREQKQTSYWRHGIDLSHSLEIETGDRKQFFNMPPHHRYVWVYLLRRFHESI